jgi:hypothetical protein
VAAGPTYAADVTPRTRRYIVTATLAVLVLGSLVGTFFR